MPDIETGEIQEVIARDPDASEGQPEQVAGRWIEAGFEDPAEVEAWIKAGYTSPEEAADLVREGRQPDEISTHGRDVVRGSSRERSNPVGEGDEPV